VNCFWTVMVHAQKPDFVFRRNGRVHLNWQGLQFSRLLAAEMCSSAVVMLATPCSEVVWRVLATHSIRQFPLHFPSRASPCAIRFQLDSTYSECVCSLSYPAYKAHAPYCFICCLPGSTLFFHITSQTAGFSRKKVIRHKLCVLTFSTSFVWNISHSKKNGARRRSTVARLLILWVRIPPAAWIYVCCECCVLSGRGLCDGLNTRPGESYWLWRVVVCDQETSKTRRLKPAAGLWKYNHNGF